MRRADREFRLAELRHVHADAAAAAITTGDPARAVELLEQARGVLLVNELDARAGSLALRGRAPHLAAEWDAVLEELADESQSTDDRQALSQRWQDVLDRIRAVPDLEAFLRPPSALDLRVTDGVVVLVNVSLWRCDALLITPEGVHAKRLRRLTFDEVEDRAGAYLAALDALDGDLVARFDAQAIVRETLSWLWETVARPVLEALGHTRPSRGAWPRVWWCPTGALTHLPLHAAGRHDVPGEAVLDRVVSSYIPTARTLSHTVVMTLLAPIAPTVTSTPNPIEPPVIRVQRIGGSDDGVSDFPRIEVAAYGADRQQAWALAEQCRQAILASPRTVVGGQLVDNARTDTPAQQVPYDQPDVRRVVALYRLTWRRKAQNIIASQQLKATAIQV